MPVLGSGQILHSRHTSAVKSACCPSISPTVVTGGADGRLVSYSIETASVQWEELLRVSKTYHPVVSVFVLCVLGLFPAGAVKR